VSFAFFAAKNSLRVARACSKNAAFVSRDALRMSLICAFCASVRFSFSAKRAPN